MTVALITGITGMDGANLADLLLSKGYTVHGIIRRSSTFNTDRIDHIFDKLQLHHGDLCDSSRISQIVSDIKPDEVYHLGAMSHVKVSFDNPIYTYDTIVMGTAGLLEAIRRFSPNSKMYFAGSSEQFGNSPPPQNENTPFDPQSPYAVAKVAGYYMCTNYRNSYDLFISCGILFNHEYSNRGLTFVTRKITRAATRIKLGLQHELRLGNIDAKRDWGSSIDYVRAMHMMLQHDRPDDFVIATGKQYSVKEFMEKVFSRLGLDWHKYYVFDDRYLRPSEVHSLLGDASKAYEILGWKPECDIDALINEMVSNDMELAEDELTLRNSRL